MTAPIWTILPTIIWLKFSVRPLIGEGDLSFHCPAAIPGGLEGLDSIGKPECLRDEGLHIDQPLLHQADAGVELFVEAERAL
jgi:hypothetical protein